jgi:hypothetical protein
MGTGQGGLLLGKWISRGLWFETRLKKSSQNPISTYHSSYVEKKKKEDRGPD